MEKFRLGPKPKGCSVQQPSQRASLYRSISDLLFKFYSSVVAAAAIFTGNSPTWCFPWYTFIFCSPLPSLLHVEFTVNSLTLPWPCKIKLGFLLSSPRSHYREIHRGILLISSTRIMLENAI
ncbi:hypothetical protein LINPERHAP1_LOCUS27760 [Linum perenne]